MNPRGYADAPKRVYLSLAGKSGVSTLGGCQAVQPTGTQLAHNTATKEALVLLSSQPEIKEWARANALAAFQDELEQLVDMEAQRWSESLFSAYGVQLCPRIAAVWVCDQLETSQGCDADAGWNGIRARRFQSELGTGCGYSGAECCRPFFAVGGNRGGASQTVKRQVQRSSRLF